MNHIFLPYLIKLAKDICNTSSVCDLCQRLVYVKKYNSNLIGCAFVSALESRSISQLQRSFIYLCTQCYQRGLESIENVRVDLVLDLSSTSHTSLLFNTICDLKGQRQAQSQVHSTELLTQPLQITTKAVEIPVEITLNKNISRHSDEKDNEEDHQEDISTQPISVFVPPVIISSSIISNSDTNSDTVIDIQDIQDIIPDTPASQIPDDHRDPMLSPEPEDFYRIPLNKTNIRSKEVVKTVIKNVVKRVIEEKDSRNELVTSSCLDSTDSVDSDCVIVDHPPAVKRQKQSSLSFKSSSLHPAILV
ncbi:MAG: hypothetical protein Sylvanvirus8_2 [Sylvanvirus sp.]|uniref:Uncharacterized protein n=1 Tax=Sylvanvirus sp. TaxID=2487774 RepID=A0A3G5AHV5_9VIRU|nr:MAG: hypothetical protein Sylvanvirus8_2 [Sylvanvirus sp.]